MPLIRKAAAAATEPGPAPGWDVVLDLSLTGLDAATLTDDAETVVTRSGVAVATVWASEVSNGGTVVAGEAGLTADGGSGSGSVSALIDVEAAAELALPGDVLNGLAIDFYLAGLADFSGSGTAWRVGIAATQTRFSVGSSHSVQGLWGSVLSTPRVATNDTFTVYTGGFDPAPSGAWTVTLLICEGAVVWAWSGPTPPSDEDLDGRVGGALCSATIPADVTSPADGLRYGSGLHAGVMAQLYAELTWERMVVRQRRIA